jgi:hypothetical protein
MMKHLPRDESPLLVLAVRRRIRFWQFHSATREKELLGLIVREIPFPGETIVISLDGPNRFLRKRIQKMLDCKIIPVN